MLSNYASAALHFLWRNRYYSAVNVVGLAVGLAAVLIIALFIRNDFSYDRFIPGVDRTYNLYTHFEQADRAPLVVDTATAGASFAAAMALAFPGIDSIARLAPDHVTIRQGELEVGEPIYWADPAIFRVLPLPAIAGDPSTALERPDSIVLTRRMARKYFGIDRPIGQTLRVAGSYPMRVDAVLEDLPSNTSLHNEIFASAKADISVIGRLDRGEQPNGANLITHIVLRLKPGASAADIQAQMPAFVTARMTPKPGQRFSFQLVPFSAIHLTPSELPAFNRPDDRATIWGLGAIGLVILFIATANFINLTLARASRRGVEIGVRRLAGATRWDLTLQFIGESTLYIGLALIASVLLMRVGYPAFSALLQRSGDWARVPTGDLAESLAVLGVGLLAVAGAYPAVVLASVRTAAVLRDGRRDLTGKSFGRQLLVMAQFAVLIGLILAACVLVRQTLFALRDSVRVDTRGVQLITVHDCRESFVNELQDIRGVTGVACSSMFALNLGQSQADMKTPDGTDAGIYAVPIDQRYMAFYGVRPVAGRLLSRDFGQDIVADAAAVHSLVLNERAVRRLGYARTDDVLGKTVTWNPSGAAEHAFVVVGVVPDFAFNAVRQPTNPSGYYVDLGATQLISLRTSPNSGPSVLADVDAAWHRMNPTQPISRAPLTQFLFFFYGDVLRLGMALVIAALIAIIVACIGLYSLAAVITEARTKEIGIRKALGASRRDILRLMLWQLLSPVLWANLIAWPLSGWLMLHWLQGFVSHVPLSPWMFLFASGFALVIALATVLAQALRVARGRPVTALRYE